MVLYIILGVVVLITVVVLGVLSFILSKEGQKEEKKTVPITDLGQLKKELSSHVFEQDDSKVIEKGTEIIPVFTPKVSVDPLSSEPQGPLQAPDEVKPPSLEDETYKKRAQELEDELHTISQKKDGQSEEARQMIETLTKENESLKSRQADLEKGQQGLTELQGEASNLKIENLKLESQLESANAKARLLEEEMAAVKTKMGDEISHANATMSDLNYELVKARAQSSALERVNINYKNQLEDLKASAKDLK